MIMMIIWMMNSMIQTCGIMPLEVIRPDLRGEKSLNDIAYSLVSIQISPSSTTSFVNRLHPLCQPISLHLQSTESLHLHHFVKQQQHLERAMIPPPRRSKCWIAKLIAWAIWPAEFILAKTTTHPKSHLQSLVISN